MSNIKSCYFLLCIVCLLPFTGLGQKQTTASMQGTVSEEPHGSERPLGSVSLSVLPYGIQTASDHTGHFSFRDIPTGPVRLIASYLGKVNVDTLLHLSRDIRIDLIMAPNSFRLEEIDVTGKPLHQGSSSTTSISRNAIEHIQANSLADVMALVPGGLTSNPDLTGARQINIRGIANSVSNQNAFGTSIVVNGAPLSNNANLQTLSPVHSTAAMSGGTPPSGGMDARTIPMYNVESVEVIRGVPDVKYGDVASGAVIVNQRAGKQPLIVEASTNPNLYSISASKGILLGERQGALNIGTEYAYNTNDPVQSYRFYERSSVTGLYSNAFFGNILNTNTGINLHFGKDTRRLNPDDEVERKKSSGTELGFVLHSSGTYRVNGATWLRNISYSGRIGLVDKNSHYQELYTSANAAYGMSYNDGATLANRPGLRIYDAAGREITHIPDGDEGKHAVYLPSTYLGIHDIRGKELNTFISTSANFFNRVGNTSHQWYAGVDLKYDKNYGAGKTFADTLPPYRNLSYVNSSYRNRAYRDIPALQQLSAYIADNMVTRLGGTHTLSVKAGVRYDRFSQGSQTFSPRINVSGDILPGRIVVHGAYGLLAKSPSLLYLYPEDAYFDYVNINEMASGREDALFITTTKVFGTAAEDLRIARNEKKEIGLDLIFGKTQMNVTLFQEKLKDGYGIGSTAYSYRPVQYVQYERVANDKLVLQEVSSHPVLAKFNSVHNNSRLEKWGLEFQLDLARFDAIRTQFGLYGAHIQQKSYSADYFYYDGQSSTSAAGRTHIGMYAPKMTTFHEKSTVTAIKATHNIPSIGFVVTLTADVLWNESDWTTYGNDSIPVKYISKYDGHIYDFDQSKRNEDEFTVLVRPVVRTNEVVESLPAMVNFNINVTKEVRDFMRVSFFANNMFRHYPVAQSDRIKSTYYKRNIPFFFGLRVRTNL